MMARAEELQARGVEMVFNSRVKAERYSEEQDKKENGQFLNISGLDRSIEEWEIE
ncbi:hypothetical protein BH18THE2_BH18THE2_14780 [soil metagenome]